MNTERSFPSRPWLNHWPWALLGLLAAVATWYVLDFEEDIDPEYPKVARVTFNARPSPAYRLAEPGDTLDRAGIYLAAGAIVVSVLGGLAARRTGKPLRPWLGRWPFPWRHSGRRPIPARHSTAGMDLAGGRCETPPRLRCCAVGLAVAAITLGGAGGVGIVHAGTAGTLAGTAGIRRIRRCDRPGADLFMRDSRRGTDRLLAEVGRRRRVDALGRRALPVRRIARRAAGCC